MIETTSRRFQFETAATTISIDYAMSTRRRAVTMPRGGAFAEATWASRVGSGHHKEPAVRRVEAADETIILDPRRMIQGLGYPFRFLDHTFLVMKRADASLDVFYVRDVSEGDEPGSAWTPAP